jgi:hypothetical protein
MLALETAIAVCYARAFTTSTLLQLGAEYAPAADTPDAELHEFLKSRRHKAIYAHRRGEPLKAPRTAVNGSQMAAGQMCHL